jgi:hypothetical protein
MAAAVAKARRPTAAVHAIEESLSVTKGVWFVAPLVAIELGVGAWLASGTRPREAIVLALGLFTLFTTYLIFQMRSRTGFACGCFGGFGDRAGALEIVRNAVLMSGLAGSLLFASSETGDALPLWKAPLSVLATTALMGAVLSLTYKLLSAARALALPQHDDTVRNRA